LRQVWHVDELSQAEARRLQGMHAIARGVVVRDLTAALSHTLDAAEVAAMRGFMCKPLAVLASSLDEVLLVDHDARFFLDPAALFESTTFVRTGMLLFRDRLRLHIRHQPVVDAPRFVRQLLRRRLGSPRFLAAEGFRPLPWPWRPSPSLLESPIVTGDSHHAIDSSVLLLSKSHAPQLTAALYILHEKYRHELYANLHGDKETYWLACELVGGLECGVSPLAPGEMGALETDRAGLGRKCVAGNLLHFHPDRPSWVVHCNCKPHASWLYTHAARPARFSELLASMARAREADGSSGQRRRQDQPRAAVVPRGSRAVVTFEETLSPAMFITEIDVDGRVAGFELAPPRTQSTN